jgi:phage N-6-adenine-methyltransferase
MTDFEVNNYQVMPELAENDFAALKADIAERGVLIPVEYDEDWNILDGHHRVRACGELGIEVWPRFVRKGLSEAEKFRHARQLNLARRHLNQDQKRGLISDQLKDTPERSNRQVAEGLGVSHVTVGGVRNELEGRGQIDHVSERTDTMGRVQPARKPIRTDYIDPEALAKKKAHVTNNSGNNEWYTPSIYIDAARDVLGGFDLDPASSEIANKTVKAKQFFAEADDGLAQDWPVGRIWMNPPYATPLISKFAAKFSQAIRNGSEGIVLVNNATETAWFQEMAGVFSAVCFPKSRIKFVNEEGDAGGAPLQGQAIIYAGPNLRQFCAQFEQFGIIGVARDRRDGTNLPLSRKQAVAETPHTAPDRLSPQPHR